MNSRKASGLRQRKRSRKKYRRNRQKNTVLKGGNKPHLGIIIHGRISSYEKSIDYVNSVFNNPKYETKVFCSLNNPSKDAYIDTFLKRFNIDSEQVNIESTPDAQWFIDANPEFCKDARRYEGLVETSAMFNRCKTMHSMFYHQNKAFKLLETYKEKHKYPFDIILVFRTDVHPSNTSLPPMYPIVEGIRPNTVYIPGIDISNTKINSTKDSSNSHANGINTISAYGDFDSMKKYCNLIQSLSQPDHAEIILLKHIKNMNLEIQRFTHEVTKNKERVINDEATAS
jgi:hypothetical protein